jgi:hypothetical protein
MPAALLEGGLGVGEAARTAVEISQVVERTPEIWAYAADRNRKVA